MIGQNVVFQEYPNLNGQYLNYNNSICPSRYNSNIKCFWEGDLSITLIFNGKEITINDHDYKSGKFSIVNDYIIQGLRSVINNKSEEETFLEFRITKN
jgi:hypothetical protein